ncbi:hypothetical protein FRC02_007661 [Tulasnella sp. 418]|nr:hypothetical protein FRC02_007661 [Tulasnella sp. 418]
MARYNYLTARSWAARQFSSTPLSRPWTNNPHPVLAVSQSRLVAIAGQTIESFAFVPPKSTYRGGGTGIFHEGRGFMTTGRDLSRDVTGVVFLPDNPVFGGQDNTLAISRADGKLMRVHLTKQPATVDPDQRSGRQPQQVGVTTSAHYTHPSQHITHLSSSKDSLLVISFKSSYATATPEPGQQNAVQQGEAAFYVSSRYPWAQPETITVPGKPRSGYLSLSASMPFVAVGSSFHTSSASKDRPSSPLTIHGLTPSSLHQQPMAYLTGSSPKRSSAVYAISPASPSSPFGNSPQVVISGWFDGRVRVHDLRLAARTNNTPGPPSLSPVLMFNDPWLDSSVYSLGMGGGHGGYIVAGMGQHGIVAIYDARNAMAPSMKKSTASGCSAYSPNGHRTPVFSLQVESARIFGATNVAFMFDFGPDEYEGTSRRGVKNDCVIYPHAVRAVTEYT